MLQCIFSYLKNLLKIFSLQKDKFFIYPRYILFEQKHKPAGIYLLKVNNRNTRARCEICSKLTIKTQKRCLMPKCDFNKTALF